MKKKKIECVIICLGDSMRNRYFELVKEQSALIEEKRLEIKNIKTYKSKLKNKLDAITTVYEYLLAPLCAISMTFATLFAGPITFVLPIAMAILAIGVNVYKYNVRKRMDVLNDRIDIAKNIRGVAYNQREQAFKKLFAGLQRNHCDEKHYYEQMENIENECNEINKRMQPYKEERDKIEKSKKGLSRVFSYVLAPLSTIVLPLVCSMANVPPVGEIGVMLASTASLLTCSSIDTKWDHKLNDLEESIDELKSDRTVKYVERDLKLNEAIEFLKEKEIINKDEKSIPIIISKSAAKTNNQSKPKSTKGDK